MYKIMRHISMSRYFRQRHKLLLHHKSCTNFSAKSELWSDLMADDEAQILDM